MVTDYRDDVPHDAGRPYKHADALMRFLEKQELDYIRTTGKWIKHHYTNTGPLLDQIRALYKRKKAK